MKHVKIFESFLYDRDEHEYDYIEEGITWVEESFGLTWWEDSFDHLNEGKSIGTTWWEDVLGISMIKDPVGRTKEIVSDASTLFKKTTVLGMLTSLEKEGAVKKVGKSVKPVKMTPAEFEAKFIQSVYKSIKDPIVASIVIRNYFTSKLNKAKVPCSIIDPKTRKEKPYAQWRKEMDEKKKAKMAADKAKKK